MNCFSELQIRNLNSKRDSARALESLLRVEGCLSWKCSSCGTREDLQELGFVSAKEATRRTTGTVGWRLHANPEAKVSHY